MRRRLRTHGLFNSLLFLELRVNDAFVLLPAAVRLAAAALGLRAATTATPRVRRGLVHDLGELVRRLGELLGGGADLRRVVRLERLLRLRDRVLDALRFARGELVL